ncbi:16S rRNA processing protein RimM [Heyndrickxia shackletonii]|uniref:Ribosome maturation factor RimM n=1 Tax=Heyndrickxia shackletonii TaxID=157838 RepID=A0A0Q3TKY1_9BACI|nr:ribosome maturation factor RimM [Heyndrickxia shackletonii]KQL54654.1 16S rRNA processing protein RimM [Heyndrickxia shackletonii]MBB2478693.1 ribosome maturation factor RimM [Bacillus sp. APMAM]NEY98304.1 ribosome maturation factor RimM [Heyndrickxia shackletonii]RTZ57834.1 ribosome maturation factor RimM [Bacillus sp. SAJ1]
MWFNVGKIVNTHGLNGEVRVISITDFKEERFKIGSILYLFITEQSKPIELVVKSHRIHKNFDLLTFEGYTNINEVEKWKNGILKVSKEQLGKLDEGEFYFHEIVGCQVLTTSNELVGVVKEILTPGANDVWVVKGEKGKEYLIPYIEPIVKHINVQEKRIIIEPMEGLLS